MNVAIYTVLRSLELEIERNDGVLPRTFNWQIDGGPENATVITIAIAELLVHRGLCNEVVLTRLPVGHTHEGEPPSSRGYVQHNLLHTLRLFPCLFPFFLFGP